MPSEHSNPTSSPIRFLYLPVSAWLLIIFSLLVFFKTCWIYSYSTGPCIFFDESIYKEMAKKIFYGQLYDEAHYPPLYPLSLSIAFLSKEHWYEWMLFINALLSSAIIFPVWLISKRMLPEKLFFLPVIMVALLPYHAIYFSVLLSENLFLLLFLFALYFSLIREKRGWFSGLLVGVFCALAFLTRYLFLPSLFLFIGLWWLTPLIKKDRQEKSIWQKLQLPSLGAVTAGFLGIYTVWLFYVYKFSALNIGEVMGLRFVSFYAENINRAKFQFSGTAVKMLNLDSLVLWITAYSSYLVLVLAPFLGILCLYFRLWFSKKENIPFRENLFFFSLSALSIGYFLLAVQHSWGSGYNYPVPRYILGRYLMHLTPLYFIAVVIALHRVGNHISYFKYSSIFIISLFALMLVWVAQRILFEQAIWKLPVFFVHTINAPDSFMYREHIALWAVLSIMVLIGISLIASCGNGRFNKPFLVQMIAGLLIFFQFSAFYKICQRTMTQEVWMIHPRRLAPILNRDINNHLESITLLNGVPGLNSNNLLNSLVFWGIPHYSLSVLPVSEKMQKVPDNFKRYFFSNCHYDNMHTLYSYDVDGKKYYLYDTNWENIKLPAPVIEDYGPRLTEAGRGFNIQPTGSSAIWLRMRYGTSGTVVVFNGQELETTVQSERLVTALVPDNLFPKPGEYQIYLLDKIWGNKSNSVVFKVK